VRPDDPEVPSQAIVGSDDSLNNECVVRVKQGRLYEQTLTFHNQRWVNARRERLNYSSRLNNGTLAEMERHIAGVVCRHNRLRSIVLDADDNQAASSSVKPLPHVGDDFALGIDSHGQNGFVKKTFLESSLIREPITCRNTNENPDNGNQEADYIPRFRGHGSLLSGTNANLRLGRALSYRKLNPARFTFYRFRFADRSSTTAYKKRARMACFKCLSRSVIRTGGSIRKQ
jgi:hypothetical protein